MKNVAKIQYQIAYLYCILFSLPSLLLIYNIIEDIVRNISNPNYSGLKYLLPILIILGMIWTLGILLMKGYGRICANNVSDEQAKRIWISSLIFNLLPTLWILIDNWGLWLSMFVGIPPFLGTVLSAVALTKIKSPPRAEFG